MPTPVGGGVRGSTTVTLGRERVLPGSGHRPSHIGHSSRCWTAPGAPDTMTPRTGKHRRGRNPHDSQRRPGKVRDMYGVSIKQWIGWFGLAVALIAISPATSAL